MAISPTLCDRELAKFKESTSTPGQPGVVVINPDGSDISTGGGGGTSLVADTTFNEGTLAITSVGETLAAVTGTNQAARKFLVITNLTTGRIFYGKTGFTASLSTAPSLAKNQSVTILIGPNLSIFLRKDSGSGTAHVQEYS